VKKACEALHVQYSYDDRSIVVVNSYYQPFANLKITAKVYNLDMTEKFAKDAELNVGPDSSTRVFTLPTIDGLSTTYFVSLTLTSEGQVKSSNFYWLSTHEETIDWSRQEEDPTGEYDISTWSPTRSFADYTTLNTLPWLNLEVTAQNKNDGQAGTTAVTVHNPTSTLALAVHLKVNKSSSGRVSREGDADNEILPVLWQDNYFALLPGETRQVIATYRIGDKNKETPSVEIDGWNVNRKTADIQQ
jgi:exo-1,4-beta-D-glucosaminidase